MAESWIDYLTIGFQNNPPENPDLLHSEGGMAEPNNTTNFTADNPTPFGILTSEDYSFQWSEHTLDVPSIPLSSFPAVPVTTYQPPVTSYQATQVATHAGPSPSLHATAPMNNEPYDPQFSPVFYHELYSPVIFYHPPNPEAQVNSVPIPSTNTVPAPIPPQSILDAPNHTPTTAIPQWKRLFSKRCVSLSPARAIATYNNFQRLNKKCRYDRSLLCVKTSNRGLRVMKLNGASEQEMRYAPRRIDYVSAVSQLNKEEQLYSKVSSMALYGLDFDSSIFWRNSTVSERGTLMNKQLEKRDERMEPEKLVPRAQTGEGEVDTWISASL
ncbi:hypothetical protein B0J11DRAFT_611350 [Dendryphion nanum]|uniref:Uncharacterized protein n=1 Tax=Dendryphion nanum TaxID=256645 RepID=A0A9P9EBN5_9PLEO|nr:hypothetical protein B0J11DRAFT_611350 [Dendryphion nanum]